MTAHPAWWTSRSATGWGLGVWRPSATAAPPTRSPGFAPAGRTPFPSPIRRQRTQVRPQSASLPQAAQAAGEAADAPSAEADAAGFVTFPLPGAAGSPAAARSLTRTTLCGWGLEELVDDATVVVSELVTNALRYGTPPGTPQRPLPPATENEPFLLSLVHYGSSVLCAVFDQGSEVPVVKEPDHLRESGRGLHVLESLSRKWGWTTPDRHGKAVWALLPAADEAGPGARDASVPGQSGQAADSAEWQPLTRLLLLLELLSGPSWLKALGASRPGPPQ